MGAVAVPKLNVILALMCLQYDDKPDALTQTNSLGSDQICDSPAMHARMGQFMMYANIISSIGCAFSSPRMGALSDRYGRKPLLAFSALGLLFGDVISMIAGLYPHKIPVHLVLLEFAIGGITGSFVATMAIIQSYAADCSEEEARMTIFGRLHACIYLGVALGPVVGGVFVRKVGRGDMLSAFYAATLCHAGFILFVLCGIAESLRHSARSKPSLSIPFADTPTPPSPSESSWLSIRNIFGPLAILRSPTASACPTSRRNLPLLACVDGVAFGIQLGLASVLVLYSEFRFGWKTMEASLFVSITNASRAIVLTLILPAISHLATRQRFAPTTSTDLNVRDRSTNALQFSIKMIRVAIFFDLLGHSGFAMASNGYLFIISGIVAAIGATVSPTAQSLMTTYVEAERIGELLGAVSLLHALARSLIPACLQLTYSLTVQTEPATVLWGGALLFGGILLLSFRIRI